MSDRTFNEAGELFGARPDAGAPMDLQVLMYSLTDEATAEPGLRKAMALADEFQGEAYGKMLPAAFDLMGQGIDFEKLRAFFHLAAAFGEARYVGRVLSNLHLAVLLKSPPTARGSA